MVKSPEKIRLVFPLEVFDLMMHSAMELNKREFAVWIAVWRHTVALNRSKRLMSSRKLGRLINMPHQKVHEALQSLAQKELLQLQKTGKGTILSINLQRLLENDIQSARLSSGNATMTGERDEEQDSTNSLDRDALLREWGRIFKQTFPHGLEANAAAILEGIKCGRIDPEGIRYPMNYLRAFKPPEKTPVIPSLKLEEGMKIKFRDEVLTVGPSCSIFYENGVIPEGDIIRLIGEGKMSIIKPDQ